MGRPAHSLARRIGYAWPLPDPGTRLRPPWRVAVTLRRLHWLGCVALVVAFSHTGRPAHAQSLVDASRLAREARQELGSQTKVYTEEDLPDLGRITEPTRAWVSRYRTLLEAALRERAFLRFLRAGEVTRPVPVTVPAPVSVPEKTVPPDPPVTSGIPLFLAYSGYPVFVASPDDPRPRHAPLVSVSSTRHTRGSRARGRQSRIETIQRPPTASRRVEPSTRRPAARNASDESSRPFSYIASGLPVPGFTGQPPPGGATAALATSTSAHRRGQNPMARGRVVRPAEPGRVGR